MSARKVEYCLRRLVAVGLLVVLTILAGLPSAGPASGQEPGDVQVIWATYIGGKEGEHDEVFDMTLDAQGNVYVVGATEATDLPHKTNEPGPSQFKAYVAKLDPSGTILWTTYVSGSEHSMGAAIAVDQGSGETYLTGVAARGDVPLPGSKNDGEGVFVSKIGSAGGIQWTAFLTDGPPFENMGTAVALGNDGNLYVTGTSTDEGLLPGVGERGGGGDAFLAKLSPSGDLLWNGYVGGPGQETGLDLVLDQQGNIWLAGQVTTEHSRDDYSLPNAVNQWPGSESSGFVTKLSPSGEIEWSLFVGGREGVSACNGLTVDDSGNAYIGGTTTAEDLTPPRTNSCYCGPDTDSDICLCQLDGFFSKIDGTGNVLWSTYATASPAMVGGDDVVIAGEDVLGLVTGSGDGLIVLDSATGVKKWYEGALDPGLFESINHMADSFHALALDAQGYVYLGGRTVNEDLPNRTNEYGSGREDGFVAKLAVPGFGSAPPPETTQPEPQATVEPRPEEPGMDIAIDFGAAPETIAPGECAALFWHVPEGDWAVIFENQEVPGDAEWQVCPETTRSYELVVEGPGGTKTATVTVHVAETVPAEPSPEPQPQPSPQPSQPEPSAQPEEPGMDIPIDFGVVPETIAPGECAVLFWHVPEGDWTVTFENQEVMGDVEWEVCPETTRSYELVVEGPGGSRTATVTVLVGEGMAPESPPEPQPQPAAPSHVQVEDSCRPGKEAYERRDFEQAALLFRGCMAKDYEYLGRSYYFRDFGKEGSDRFDAAIVEFEKALMLDPDNADVYDFLGRIHFFLDDYDQAWTHLEKASQLNPELPDPYHLRGFISYERGEYEQAIPLLQKYVQLGGEANEANASEYLGRAFYGLRDYEQARSHLERAVQLDPELAEVHYFLGMIVYRQKDYERALPLFQKSRDLGAGDLDAQVWTQLGWTYHRLERYQEAEQSFLQAIALDETNPNTYGGLGAAYYRMGQCDKAIPMYEKAIELAPDFQGWRDGLARCQ